MLHGPNNPSTHIIILLCLLWLAVLPRTVAADPGLNGSCWSRFQPLATRDGLSTFDDISNRYQRALASEGSHWKRPDPLRNLYNPADWKKQLSLQKSGAPSLYGKSTDQHYLQAQRWVDSLSDHTPINSSLLKSIHQRACKDMFFGGFEVRRIRNQIQNGKMNNAKYKEIYHQIFAEHRAFSGVDHGTLAGNFRTLPEDQIALSPFANAADTTPKFTARQFEQIKTNPGLEVLSIEQAKPNGDVYAKVRYMSSEKVQASVDATFAALENDLKNSAPLQDKVLAIVKMERRLIGIHPFHDGNGRSIRLLRDLLYRRIGLPPPLHPFEEDLFVSNEELMEIERRGMLQYLDAGEARSSN